MILYQILSTDSFTNCMEISWENLYGKIILSFKGAVNTEKPLLTNTYLLQISILFFYQKYRKIPKISPRAYIFQRPFLRGLFLEGLTFGGAYV